MRVFEAPRQMRVLARDFSACTLKGLMGGETPLHKNAKSCSPPQGVTKSLRLFEETGAGEGARTLDPDLGKVVLYH